MATYYNIRGTSGSGKSTLVREIMERYDTKIPVFIEGRKNPIGYLMQRHNSSYVLTSLFVIGSYETACGGVDTITKREDTFKLVRQAIRKGYDVIAEGVILSDETKHTISLHQEGFKIRVLGLTTALDVCLENILKRRREKNPDAEAVDPNNTAKRIPTIARAIDKLSLSGIRTMCCDYRNALNYLVDDLGLRKSE